MRHEIRFLCETLLAYVAHKRSIVGVRETMRGVVAFPDETLSADAANVVSFIGVGDFVDT